MRCGGRLKRKLGPVPGSVPDLLACACSCLCHHRGREWPCRPEAPHPGLEPRGAPGSPALLTWVATIDRGPVVIQKRDLDVP